MSTIIVSISGGKDSAAMILDLVEKHPADTLVAHYQVLPEDWPGTLEYNQRLCARLGVRLVAQQILYRPSTVKSKRGASRLEVRDIHTEADIVHWGTDGVIAGVTDLAYRRQWPPSAGVRFCTRWFKMDLLNWWIINQQHDRVSSLGEQVTVALGERAGESPRRARKPEWVQRFKRREYVVENWLPVHSWSRRQVFRRLRDWGIEPHPAYKAQGMTDWQMYDENAEGGPRTSCRFCIYASQAEVCHQAQVEANRGLLRYIQQFESTTGRTWWMNRSIFDAVIPSKVLTHQLPLF